MKTTSEQKFVEFAIPLARRVGDYLLMRRVEAPRYEWTQIGHFRTQVDIGVRDFVMPEIKAEFPEWNIRSEESDSIDCGSRYTVEVDENDGTIEYTRFLSHDFAFCITLYDRDSVVAGVTNAPALQFLVSAVRGGGTIVKEEKFHLRDLKPPMEIPERAVYTFHLGKSAKADRDPQLFSDLYLTGMRMYRATCSASASLLHVLFGKQDAYVGIGLEPEDTSSMEIALLEAGFLVTNFRGEPRRFGHQTILAAPPILHGKILALLQSKGWADREV